MSSRQARHLLQGSLSRSRRVSASHPKRHSASEGVPSASSFLMEARSSLGSGSPSDAGRPSAWMARRVAADIRSFLVVAQVRGCGDEVIDVRLDDAILVVGKGCDHVQGRRERHIVALHLGATQVLLLGAVEL